MARFQPGVSGNPGGRPRSDPHRARAARRAAEEAVLVLLAVARDRGRPWGERRRACLDVLAAAYGRRGVVPPAAELVAAVSAELLGVAAAQPPPPAPQAPARLRPRISLVR